MSQETAHAHDADNKHHHIIPVKTLTTVFLALVALTILTVVTAVYMDFGVLNVPIALAIAGTKATLVVSIFMALYYDSKVNTMVFTVGTVFVVVFLAFTLLDTSYRGDLGNVSVETVSDEERRAERLQAREPSSEELRVAPADYPEGSASSTEGATGAASPAADTTSASGDS